MMFFPRDFSSRAGLALETHKNFVLGLSSVILIADSVLFYYAMVNQGIWGGGSLISFPALLATAAYTAILIFVSYVTVYLED